MSYWYEHRDELESGMIFRDYEGYVVLLDRRVPGDGTQWYVASYHYGSWCYDDCAIEPGDLREKLYEKDFT